MTPQRRAIAEVLAGEHVHLTAEQVLAAARRVEPAVSQATVYSTLRELVTLGEVDEIRVAGVAAQYDPNGGDGHHHLVCSSCGMVFDVHPAGIEALRLGRGDLHGFSLDGVELTFRGRCAACGERGAPATV
jgi:Fur family ferric uptake transcriptional regulator